ncbi:MAG: hypothetical protein RLZZ01_186, partial [Actinomycetota bacterium]
MISAMLSRLPRRRRRLTGWLSAGVAAVVVVSAGFTGAPSSAAVPAPPVPLDFVNDQITSISAAYDVSCVVSGANDGAVYCWGYQSYGELGVDPNLIEEFGAPIRVVDNPDEGFANSSVDEVIAGWYHVCALQDGSVFCWGYNEEGELGNGLTEDTHLPQRVDNGADGFTNSNVTMLAVGGYHSCAIEGGSVYCWGYNPDGPIGDGTSDDALVPVKVSANGDFANSGVTSISAGGYTTCAVEAGEVFCWGYNRYGGVGNGSSSGADELLPVKVATNGDFANSGVTDIATGYYHSCAIEAGELFCWGANDSYQVGNGDDSEADVYAPAKVAANGDFANSGVADVEIRNSENTCALEDGQVFCWGDNSEWQFGFEDDTTDYILDPTPVPAASGFTNTEVTDFDVAEYNGCFVEGGRAFCSAYTSGYVGHGFSDSNDDHDGTWPNVFPLASFSPMLDNGVMRTGELVSAECDDFGTSGCDDGHPDTALRRLPSLTMDGRLRAPYYWSTVNEAWMQLVYEQDPLDVAVGVGSGGWMWNGNTHVASSDGDYLGWTVNDGSGWTATAPSEVFPSLGTPSGSMTVDGPRSTGTAAMSGATMQIGGATLGIDHTYRIEPGTPVISVRTTVTNDGDSTVENVHLWAGTGDDYIAGNDSNAKARGALSAAGFTQQASDADRNDTILVTSETDAVLFTSPDEGVQAIFNTCCDFYADIVLLDPAISGDDQGCDDTYNCGGEEFDGGYGIVRDLGDLAPGESKTFTYRYAAASIDDLAAVLAAAFGPAGPTDVTPTPGPGQVTVSWTAVPGAVRYI